MKGEHRNAIYEKDTNVFSELSRLEIEKALIKYGAENFAYATSADKAIIGFTMHERQVRFVLPLPKREELRLTPTGRDRMEKSQYDAWEFILPQIATAYDKGTMPAMLPMLRKWKKLLLQSRNHRKS